MIQPKLKPTEFAINMCCSALALIQQEHLAHPFVTELFAEQPAHIYFVVRRPRLVFIPDTFKIDSEFIEIDYQIQYKQTFHTKHLKTRNYLGSNNVNLICDFPFTEYKIIDINSKEILSQGFVAALLNSLYYYIDEPSFLDCEVLYIGQAFGKDGSRTAIDRLQKHSTLQLIYSEAIKKNPDSEIWLCLSSFDQLNYTVMDGHSKFSKEELELDAETYTDRFWKINYEGLNEAQKINFTEAALIRYFQPPYNKEYKDSFPTKEHSSYSECYDLDINAVCFEIDTSDKILCCLYSAAIERKYLHMTSFLLHSPDERKIFFDLF